MARGVARQARQARQARLAMEAPATNREILTKGAHDPMLKNMLNFMSKKYVKYTNRIKYVYVYIYKYAGHSRTDFSSSQIGRHWDRNWHHPFWFLCSKSLPAEPHEYRAGTISLREETPATSSPGCVGGKQKRSVGVAVRVRLDPKWPRFGRFLHIYRYYLRQNEQICWPLSNRFFFLTNRKALG